MNEASAKLKLSGDQNIPAIWPVNQIYTHG
jgi:hypothetical protein